MSRLLILAGLLFCFASQAEVPVDVAEQFRARYPKVPATAFEASPVEGLVAVRSDDTRFFYAPGSGLLLFGEFFTPDGKVLAGRSTDTPQSPLPSTDASIAGNPAGVRVKDGPVVMTAYLDVHCGYCAQAVDWIVSRGGLPDAGLDVVFVSRSEQDLALAEHVLCAPKHLRGTALQQVFSRGPGVERLRCEKGRAEALAHEGIAARHGVSATPVFAVKGQTVLGFDRERLESLVDQTGKQPKG